MKGRALWRVRERITSGAHIASELEVVCDEIEETEIFTVDRKFGSIRFVMRTAIERYGKGVVNRSWHPVGRNKLMFKIVNDFVTVTNRNLTVRRRSPT